MTEVYHEGLIYTCVECAYQAAKTLSLEESREFIGLTPGQAKRKGRKIGLRPDWEKVKLSIMHDIILSKFTRNKTILGKLLQTKNTKLIEGNNWNDTFWGVCNGKGENHLGQILMQVRDELRVLKSIC